MRKVRVSRMRDRYAQTVLTFRITYVLIFHFRKWKTWRNIHKFFGRQECKFNHIWTQTYKVTGGCRNCVIMVSRFVVLIKYYYGDKICCLLRGRIQSPHFAADYICPCWQIFATDSSGSLWLVLTAALSRKSGWSCLIRCIPAIRPQ